MIGIVVEENQLAGAAFHDNVHSLTPMAMSPSALVGLVLFREVLRVINQHIRSFCQLADAFIKYGMAGFVVRGVDQHLSFGLQTETKAALRMIQPHGADSAIVKGNRPFLNAVEMATRRHFTHVHREVWI